MLSRARRTRFLILFTAFVCSACGIIYELALISVGSYLVGSSIVQTSLVISVVLSAMGLGALAAKRFLKHPVEAFVGVELTLGLVGAASIPILYAAFAWLDIYTPVLLIAALLIGMLIGAEIPLLMSLVQMVRRQDAGEAVADLSAADYGGSLIGGLAFPFLLLPIFGLTDAAIAAAFLNLLAGTALVGWRLRSWLGFRSRVGVTVASVTTLVALSVIATTAAQIEVNARQSLYQDPIVFSQDTAYQQIVMTEAAALPFEQADTRLFLNGDLQFSSVDEYRYHESLVHPAMNGDRANVLVLGGGDGLAVREILRYPDVESVTLVELDPAVVELARTNEALTTLNDNAFADPRVETISADAFSWVRSKLAAPQRFDAIVIDFPDPDNVDVAKLYSQEMYGMTARLLAPNGRMAVQAGSPYFVADAYWSIVKTIETTGLDVTPYQVDVPSFGNWGFALARSDSSGELSLSAPPPADLKYLDNELLSTTTVFPKDRDRRPVDASTLLDPTVLDYYRSGWQN
jgi:spermidine synthase